MTNIYALLHEGKLVDAITQLKAKTENIGDWQLQQNLEEVTSTYSNMLNYIIQGYDDPEGYKLKQDLIRKVYAINDSANRLIRLKKQTSDIYCQICRNSAVNNLSWEQLIIKLETEGESISTINNSQKGKSPYSPEKEKEIIEQHDLTTATLFNKCWTSALWTKTENDQYSALLTSENILLSDKAIVVSAVFLSLLELFDQQKLMFLFEAYENEDLTISQRALVGIIIILTRYDGRIKYYTEITSRFSLYCENKQFIHELFSILMQLQYSKLTDMVSAKIENDIMPTLSKVALKAQQDFTKRNKGTDINNLDSEEFIENGENPDWLINSKENKKTEKLLNQMYDMQKEGADVQMSTFKQLKSFPFFSSIHHWIMPFSFNVPYIVDVYHNLRPEVNNILNKLLDIAKFCDNDKYSLVQMIGQLPTVGQDIMLQQIDENTAGANLDDFTSQNTLKVEPRDKKAPTISRSYIYDLYRLFNLYPYHHQLFNPFDKKLENFSPLNISSLAPLLENYDEMLALAEFFMRRGIYNEAKSMFLFLKPQEREEDADIWQKIGFCQQKLKDPQALNTYIIAESLQPNSKWTQNHIIQVAFEQQEYNTAIEYIDKLLANDEDNQKLILRKAEALFGLDKYEEALPLLYKVIYLNENLLSGKEMLAWALTMTKQLDKAERAYKELTDNNNSLPDLIRLGHVIFLKGDTHKAIKIYSKAYRRYLVESTTEQFISDFWQYSGYLKRIGADIEKMSIILDAVRMGIE